MNLIEQYLLHSQEIIGDRTQPEKRYDNEVIRWLRKGKNIGKAIDKANKKYPKEAHLHAFRLKRPHGKKIIEIGIPTDDFDDIEILPGWDEYIADYFWEPGRTARYEYDFGDSWHHEILLEGILLKEKGTKYPICIDGQRACPPEDCGGIRGYENLLKILRDPNHEEYESRFNPLFKKPRTARSVL